MDTSECITCPTDAVSECFIIMPVGKNVKNFGNKVNKDEEKKRDTCIMHSKSFLP